MRPSISTTTLLVALFALPMSAGAQVQSNWKYKVTQVTVSNLGVAPDFASSAAWDINNLGDVVGHLGFVWFADTGGSFYMRPGAIPMQVITDGISTHSQALAINDSRLVVGWMWYQDNWQGYYWKPGLVPTPLKHEPTPVPGISWRSEARAVSNTGQIVGRASTNEPVPSPPCSPTAVSWSSPLATPAAFFCLPGYVGWEDGRNEILDVNDAGTIIGNDDNGFSFPTWMYIRKAGRSSAIPLPAATPSGNYDLGIAEGLNDANQVAGSAHRSDGQWQAFYWNGTSPTAVAAGVPAGAFHSFAYDLNEQQMLVGRAQFPGFVWRAFIWHPHFGFKLLPSLSSARGESFCRANAVNDRKESSGFVQVVGTCDDNQGAYRAVIWNVTVARETVVIPPVQ